MDQLSLMANEAEAYAYGTKNATAEQVAVKAHARKRQSGNVLDIVPEGTPKEVVEHRLSEEERICDVCGEKLVQRKDDMPETVLDRLKTYHEQTEPLKGFYEKKGILRVVEGQEEVADTTALTFQALED